MPRFASLIIKKGTLVYHGTAKDTDFQEFRPGFAWVAKAREVAEHFARLRGGDAAKLHGGSKNRVVVFQAVKDIKLILIKGRAAWMRLMKHMRVRYDTPQEMAQAAYYYFYRDLSPEQRYDGWIVPQNYINGDDLLLFNPNSVLKFIRTEPITGRYDPRQ